MDLSFDYQIAAPALTNVAYTLRYEITCGMILLLLWCFGRLVGIQRKTHKSKQFPKSFDQSYAPRITHGKSVREDTLHTSANDWANFAYDPKKLHDSTWVVQHVIQLCRSQALRPALNLYRAAVKEGLDIRKLSEPDCVQVFTSLVTSTVRTNQIDEAKQLLQDLGNSVGIPHALLASVVKLCTSKQLFADCLAVYDLATRDGNCAVVEKTVWSCLLFSAIETREYSRCYAFFNHLKECGTPSHKDFGNMVRFASLNGDWQLSVNILKDMRDSSVEIDCVIYNTCLNTCIAANKMEQATRILEEMERETGVADAITYNTLMKGYAKSGQMEPCLVLFNSLQERNIEPTQVTYGIVLDGLINDGQLDKATQVFNTMSKEGVPMNTVLYTTLIKGFARAGEADQAMKVYGKMRGEIGMPPDLITFSILIKANCDIDRLDVALRLLDEMLALGLRPDEVVFNNLLGGCARVPNAQLGKRLYADMIASGVRPSNATFSILIRLYQQSKLLEDAVEMLRNEPMKHKVNPEPRLYLQLIQSCIRDRQGRRAVEVYQMMTEHSVPQVAAHSSIITTCVKLNMYETAAEILALAAVKGGRVDFADAATLLEGAVRKRKSQVAHEIAASMEKLGFKIDPKLAS